MTEEPTLPPLPEPYMWSEVRSIPPRPPVALYVESQMRAYALAAVQAAVAAYREDAERYRWLRKNSTQPAEPWSTHSCPESLDEIVDAAIRAADPKAQHE